MKHRITISLILSMLSIVLSIISLTSCSRKVSKSFSKSSTQVESKSEFIDTSKATGSYYQEKTYSFGDTLKGSLYFNPYVNIPGIPSRDSGNNILSESGGTAADERGDSADEPLAEDSLESNGIKVKVKLYRKDAGIKIGLEAISKPKNIMEKSGGDFSLKKATSASQFFKLDKKKTEKQKDTETDNSWSLVIMIVIGAVCFLLIALLLNWLYNKAKNKGIIGKD